MYKSNLTYEQLLAENVALREENQILRQRLGMGTPAPVQLKLTSASENLFSIFIIQPKFAII